MSNARITVTIPYDEIPNEVEKLIQKSMSKMSFLVDMLKNGVTENHTKTLEDIENTRKKLVLIDANLEDAYNILLGYIQNEIKIKQEKVSPNEPENI